MVGQEPLALSDCLGGMGHAKVLRGRDLMGLKHTKGT